jgi:hypothetical protein
MFEPEFDSGHLKRGASFAIEHFISTQRNKCNLRHRLNGRSQTARQLNHARANSTTGDLECLDPNRKMTSGKNSNPDSLGRLSRSLVISLVVAKESSAGQFSCTVRLRDSGADCLSPEAAPQHRSCGRKRFCAPQLTSIFVSRKAVQPMFG